MSVVPIVSLEMGKMITTCHPADEGDPGRRICHVGRISLTVRIGFPWSLFGAACCTDDLPERLA